MSGCIDLRALLLRIRSPQHEYQILALFVKHFDYAGRQTFPAALGVRAGQAVFNSQYCIKQKHALSGPAFQTTMPGWNQPKVAFNLLEDILQGGRWGYTRRH